MHTPSFVQVVMCAPSLNCYQASCGSTKAPSNFNETIQYNRLCDQDGQNIMFWWCQESYIFPCDNIYPGMHALGKCNHLENITLSLPEVYQKCDIF